MRVVVVLQIELLPKAFKGLFASCCLCYFMPFSSKHYCTVVPSDIENVFLIRWMWLILTALVLLLFFICVKWSLRFFPEQLFPFLFLLPVPYTVSTRDTSGANKILGLIITSNAVYNCPVRCRHGVRVTSRVILIRQHLKVYNVLSLS